MRALRRCGLAIRPRENDAMTKKDTEAVRRARVRQLFEALPLGDHRENRVLKFHGWLHQYHPELLPKRRGDAYQHLKVDLQRTVQVAQLPSTRYRPGDSSPRGFDMEKRPKPVTVCTDCGAPGYDVKLSTGSCGRMVRGKRCRGTNQSAIGDNDWRECPACAASGYEGVAQCGECDGFGWFFQR